MAQFILFVVTQLFGEFIDAHLQLLQLGPQTGDILLFILARKFIAQFILQ
jgi:hypothetical protein